MLLMKHSDEEIEFTDVKFNLASLSLLAIEVWINIVITPTVDVTDAGGEYDTDRSVVK